MYKNLQYKCFELKTPPPLHIQMKVHILCNYEEVTLVSAAPYVDDSLLGLVCTSLASLRSSECTDFSEAALLIFNLFFQFQKIQGN